MYNKKGLGNMGNKGIKGIWEIGGIRNREKGL